MIRKMLFVFGVVGVLISSLFANNIVVGNAEHVGKDIYQSMIEDKQERKVYFTYFYPTSAINIGVDILTKTKNSLVKTLCSDPTIRNGINNQGYEIIITYVYTNHVVVHNVINSCR